MNWVRSRRTRHRLSLASIYVIIGLFAIFFLFPICYMAVTSFKTNQEIESLKGVPFLIQRGATLDHYRELFQKTDFLVYFKNTTQVAVLATIISMLISILAAYGLSRLAFVGSGAIATGIFLTYLVPESLLFIPLFKIVGSLGLLNKKWALLLVFPTAIVPFCTWILIGYFAAIPRQLEEAALVDGATYLQMLIRVFLPVALPGLVAATLFAFTLSWASFLYPMALIYTSNEQVLTAGVVSTLIRGDVYHWGGLMAGALMACLPPVIFYVFLMDYYISGLTAGATKG